VEATVMTISRAVISPSASLRTPLAIMLRHHSTVELVNRASEAGLVERRVDVTIRNRWASAHRRCRCGPP
jgi:hypothetical protein